MWRFAKLSLERVRIPDETTILRFRRRLEKNKLLMGQGTLVDATLINAPSATKNKDRKRDPDRHSTKKGNQYYFGMKAHIGVDQDSGAVHSITDTAANISETHKLLHDEEKMIYGDTGSTGLEKSEEMKDCKATMHIAMKRGKLKKLLEEDSKEG